MGLLSLVRHRAGGEDLFGSEVGSGTDQADGSGRKVGIRPGMRAYLNKLIQEVTNWLYQARRRVAIAGVGLLACFIGYHAVFGANGFLVYREQKTQLRPLRHQRQSLQP